MPARNLDDPEEFNKRVAEVLAEEANAPRRTWWLSFADGNRPKGEQFLGVILVDDCPGLAHARLKMTLHGVESPGGEIRGIGFDPEMVPPEQKEAMAKLPRLKLLSKNELLAAGIGVGLA